MQRDHFSLNSQHATINRSRFRKNSQASELSNKDSLGWEKAEMKAQDIWFIVESVWNLWTHQSHGGKHSLGEEASEFCFFPPIPGLLVSRLYYCFCVAENSNGKELLLEFHMEFEKKNKITKANLGIIHSLSLPTQTLHMCLCLGTWKLFTFPLTLNGLGL